MKIHPGLRHFFFKKRNKKVIALNVKWLCNPSMVRERIDNIEKIFLGVR